jgi:hypothetical protein
MDKQFYKNLKEFLKDLVIIFPEDDEVLQIASTSITLAIIEDTDKIIINKFYKSLFPLETQIKNKDISVFSSETHFPPNSYEAQLFFKIQQNWETFSEHNKTILWDYISLLYSLSKMLNV